MDTAASGIMVPMINTVEEAAAAVKAAKFAPIGNRSYGGRRPIDMYGRSYAHTANEDTCLILQIETLEGLANVDEIASVPGFDVLFFGPDDLAMQLALPMDKPRKADLFKNEMEKVVYAAQKAGKVTGTVTTSPEILDIAVKTGYRLCVGTTDAALLGEGSKRMKEKLTGVDNEKL